MPCRPLVWVITFTSWPRAFSASTRACDARPSSSSVGPLREPKPGVGGKRVGRGDHEPLRRPARFFGVAAGRLGGTLGVVGNAVVEARGRRSGTGGKQRRDKERRRKTQTKL